MSNSDSNEKPSRTNVWAWAAVLIGVASLTLVFLVITSGAEDLDPVGAFGVFATPVVSVVTAFFGIQAGTKATEGAAKNNAESIAAVNSALDTLKTLNTKR